MEYIKKIGVFILFGLLMLRVMIVPILYFEYEVGKDYITKNYCINKNRPQLHCNGKCYLAKQIKAAQEKEEQEGVQDFVLKLITECFACTLAHQFDFTPFLLEMSNSYSFYIFTLFPSINQSIFQPPE